MKRVLNSILVFSCSFHAWRTGSKLINSCFGMQLTDFLKAGRRKFIGLYSEVAISCIKNSPDVL